MRTERFKTEGDMNAKKVSNAILSLLCILATSPALAGNTSPQIQHGPDLRPFRKSERSRANYSVRKFDRDLQLRKAQKQGSSEIPQSESFAIPREKSSAKPSVNASVKSSSTIKGAIKSKNQSKKNSGSNFQGLSLLQKFVLFMGMTSLASAQSVPPESPIPTLTHSNPILDSVQNIEKMNLAVANTIIPNTSPCAGSNATSSSSYSLVQPSVQIPSELSDPAFFAGADFIDDSISACKNFRKESGSKIETAILPSVFKTHLKRSFEGAKKALKFQESIDRLNALYAEFRQKKTLSLKDWNDFHFSLVKIYDHDPVKVDTPDSPTSYLAWKHLTFPKDCQIATPRSLGIVPLTRAFLRRVYPLGIMPNGTAFDGLDAQSSGDFLDHDFDHMEQHATGHIGKHPIRLQDLEISDEELDFFENYVPKLKLEDQKAIYFAYFFISHEQSLDGFQSLKTEPTNKAWKFINDGFFHTRWDIIVHALPEYFPTEIVEMIRSLIELNQGVWFHWIEREHNPQTQKIQAAITQHFRKTRAAYRKAWEGFQKERAQENSKAHTN